MEEQLSLPCRLRVVLCLCYIEVGGDSREVHEIFSVSSTTMINTGAGATKAPVMYRVNGTGAVNIKVEVKMLKYIH